MTHSSTLGTTQIAEVHSMIHAVDPYHCPQ